ncbi:MAG: hypothetical protein PUP93_32200 [Rhizonema sp. NSF051]|nr:hypothetical protein [Rhizonema sp. NSF051]
MPHFRRRHAKDFTESRRKGWDEPGQKRTKEIQNRHAHSTIKGAFLGKARGREYSLPRASATFATTQQINPLKMRSSAGESFQGASECEDGCPFLSRKNVAADASDYDAYTVSL